MTPSRRLVTALAVLSLLGAILPLATVQAQVPDGVPKVPSNLNCDPLDPEMCLFPFPNDVFTVPDPTTDTGLRVNFWPDAMPRNGTEITGGGEGKPVDPTEWNRNDGFSPGSPVLTYVPGLDLHQTWGTQDRPHSEAAPNEVGYFDHRDHIADVALYRNEGAPIVILNAETGERHPFWSELDTHPDAVASGEQTLILRPAVNFEEGARYVVALRNLKGTHGNTIAPRPEFAGYINGSGASAARQADYNEEIFPVLEAAGIAKDDLYLAWDFTVASENNLAGRILHMRDDAFGRILGDPDLSDRQIQGTAPAFVVDRTSEFTDSWTDSRGRSHSATYRRIQGRVTVPNYMDRIQQTESHFKEPGTPPEEEIQYDAPAPGSRLLDIDRDGLPDQNPVESTVNPFFVCEVPIVKDGQPVTDPLFPGLYGHGLLGQARDQIQDFRRSPGRWGPFFGCAADWWGMATQDLPTVLGTTLDMSLFPTIPDRAQQGFLNFMFLGRAAAHPEGFASHPAFQQNGESLVVSSPVGEETRLYYDGNSQGGIMGGSLVAVSPDISRAILGVPGMNYSTLLNRSVDFEGAEFGLLVYNSYRDVIERQLVFGLMQMLWDRGEANGFAHHMTSDPLPNTPPHDVMLQVAWSDHQVANVSAEVEARTIGAPIMVPGLPTGRHWEMNPYFGPTAGYPHQGSALVYWDSGNATPPNGNIPPNQNGDPHGHGRHEPAAGWQEAHFLLTGEMEDVCEGGDYLTRRHPDNGGTGSSPPSCHPPDREPGTQPSPPPTEEPTPTDTVEPSPSDTVEPSPTDPGPTTTALEFTGRSKTAGQYSDETLFEVTLKEEDSGAPLVDAEIVFELAGPEGTQTYTDRTDQDGVAAVTPILTQRPESHFLTVHYTGDADHGPDTIETFFTVEKEETASTLSVQGKGSKAALVARLADLDSDEGISGRLVEFFADGKSIGTATTGDQGRASLDLPPRYQGGHHDFEARFAGDPYYLPSGAETRT